MKERITTFLLPAALLVLILFAPVAASGAANGLILWYRHVLPVLMPFTLIVQLMMASGVVLRLSQWTGPVVTYLTGLSPVCSFCILTGFLCGFPMGAVTAANALNRKLISRDEAQLLAGTCNNAGPMFVSSYILDTQLHAGNQRASLTIIFYGCALLWLLLRSLHLKYHRAQRANPSQTMAKHPMESSISQEVSYRKILLDSSELMLKVGVFMMLFAILCAMLNQFSVIPDTITALLSMLLEITNGAAAISSLQTANKIKTVLTMSGTAFGGLCIAAQTYTVIHSQKLSFVKYLLDKAVISLLTGLITILLN